MLKLLGTLTLVCGLAASTAAALPAAQERRSAVPRTGLFVVGKSLAGVSLGHTPEQVRKRLGSNFVVCPQDVCKDKKQTWLYYLPADPSRLRLDPVASPVGMAVRFKNNKAYAVFTLGAVLGWKSSQGIKIADPTSRIYEFYGNTATTDCIGYQALSLRTGSNVSSFYLTGGVVYGFALTAPGVPVCQ
jgi:hypothetical protein